VAITMRAPGRDVEYLMPGGRQRRAERPSVASGVLNADHGVGRIVLGQPAAQPLDPVAAVGEAQGADFPAARVKQGRGVRALVDIDADDQPVDLLAWM
jgi:hypothetical protein